MLTLAHSAGGPSGQRGGCRPPLEAQTSHHSVSCFVHICLQVTPPAEKPQPPAPRETPDLTQHKHQFMHKHAEITPLHKPNLPTKPQHWQDLQGLLTGKSPHDCQRQPGPDLLCAQRTGSEARSVQGQHH